MDPPLIRIHFAQFLKFVKSEELLGLPQSNLKGSIFWCRFNSLKVRFDLHKKALSEDYLMCHGSYLLHSLKLL